MRWRADRSCWKPKPAKPTCRNGWSTLIWRPPTVTRELKDHELTGEAAAWLVKQGGAKIVGVDTATPDLPPGRRPADVAFPVYYTPLSQGVLIAEHVTGLAPLSGGCTEIMFLGLNIAGSDGAPARATARAID
jgi:kynurenine formamidase